MATERASRAILALEGLKKLMDLYEEYEEEAPPPKKRKTYVKSEDIETRILKDVTWKQTATEDAFIPMTMDNFEDIFAKFKLEIKKHNLKKPAVAYRLRLAITLRYLIKGESYRILEKICHFSRKIIAKIVSQSLSILIQMWQEEYLKLPSSTTQWLNISNDFGNYWQFPHTLGVLDAKQFRMNYTNSTLASNFVMLSIIDAHSRFLYTEIIECDEETNESAIYINSNLYKLLKFNTLEIPAAKRLKGQTMKTEYYFVGTEVFGMDRYVLKEYHESQNLNQTQKAFNYRLNRVCLCGRMAFDLLFYRFKIFERFEQIDKCSVRLVIKACSMLHNYLTQSLDHPFSHDDDGNNTDSSSKICMPLAMQFFEKHEDYSQRSENIGNYCVNEGDIPEQWIKIVKTES